jgi:hypothetical protein
VDVVERRESGIERMAKMVDEKCKDEREAERFVLARQK